MQSYIKLMTIYENNLAHLLDELHRIDLIVGLHIEKWRAERKQGANEFGLQGLYISEDEVSTILQNPPYVLEADVSPGLKRIETITSEINRNKLESIKQGKELRLPMLTELFNLQPFEVDILLICLASELDLRYEKLYSYLQNDVTKKRPSVDLVIKLLYCSTEERFWARDIFFARCPPDQEQACISYRGGTGSPFIEIS